MYPNKVSKSGGSGVFLNLDEFFDTNTKLLMFKKAVLLLFVVLFAVSCEEQPLQRPLIEYVITNPAQNGTRYPNFYKDNSGRLYMSWLTGIEEDIYAMEYSTYKDGRWTEPGTVIVDTNFFVNWADYPSVVGFEGNELAAHRLRKTEGGPYAYNVEISFFEDASWKEPIIPHEDGTATEHGFVSLEPINSERILSVWLDGRMTANRADDEYADTSKSMTFRSAEITRSGDILNKQVIKIARYDTETGIWSEPMTVHNDNWQIMACPVNGPAVTANGNEVAVAWFTGANDNPRVLLARSSDGGRTFSEPVLMNESAYRVLGRTDVAMDENGSVYVSWMQEFEGMGYVMIRNLQPDGTLSDPQTVGITDSSRSSGFPQLALMDDSLMIAWTQTEPVLRIRTASYPLVNNFTSTD